LSNSYLNSIAAALLEKLSKQYPTGASASSPSSTKDKGMEHPSLECLDEEMDSVPRDEVACWWLELPESQRTVIYIRKVHLGTICIGAPSETTLIVGIQFKIAEEEIAKGAEACQLDKQKFIYHISKDVLKRETIIDLENPILNSPQKELETEDLLVLSYKMKQEIVMFE